MKPETVPEKIITILVKSKFRNVQLHSFFIVENGGVPFLNMVTTF